MTPTTLSISLMLIRGQLVQGHAIQRSTAIVAPDADAAWAQLLTAGETFVPVDVLPGVRDLFAGWVMEGVAVGVNG